MSSQSATKLRALYRSFLRELPPRPILASPRAPLHAQLRSQFESSTKASDAAATASHAEQYLSFLQGQRTYAMLVERYNPGMAGNMDEAERIRLTARRVGMNLPVEFEDGQDSGEASGKK